MFSIQTIDQKLELLMCKICTWYSC